MLDFDYNYLGDYHDGKMLAYKYEFIDGESHHNYGVIAEAGEWILQLVESVF